MKKPVLVIASTGAANLASVVAMCERAGVEPVITKDPGLVADAEKLLLPGVGAFGAAMENLSAGKLDKVLASRIDKKQPTMGICLGMQLFCESSHEAPGVGGIGAIPARVQRFSRDFLCPNWAGTGSGLGAAKTLSKPAGLISRTATGSPKSPRIFPAPGAITESALSRR